MRSTLLCLSLVLFSCGDDSGGFVALDKACVAYAETACAARAHCCDDPGDQAACETRVLDACEPARDLLTAEPSLRYDGEHARAALDELAVELDACGDLPPLSRLFDGGRAQGAMCDQGAECASSVCADGLCAAPQSAPLCAL